MQNRCVVPVMLTLFSVVVFLYCEWFIYYQAVYRCDWPELDRGPQEGRASDRNHGNDTEHQQGEGLRVLVLADPHLLGAKDGHWLDKLRREWQMRRSFQTAVSVLAPDMVFILGDVFDEGSRSNQQEWEEDVRRFRQIFRCPGNTELIAVAGNHDVGYHYQTVQSVFTSVLPVAQDSSVSIHICSSCSGHRLTRDKLQRFHSVFNHTTLISRRGVNLILVNSMALEGDADCSVCSEHQSELHSLSLQMNCSREAGRHSGFCRHMTPLPPSDPIIIQHFPLYRQSDSECEGSDPLRRPLLFRERYDTLSLDTTHRLLWWFRPRLLLSGHTHCSCLVIHSNRYPEVSVRSFNWRNRNDPGFLLAVFSSSLHQLSQCVLPEESMVVMFYCGAALLAGLVIAATPAPLKDRIKSH